MYYNSIAQELRINDSVVYDELNVETESGLYTPSVKIKRNYRIGKIIGFKELKKYTKAIVEFNYYNDKETIEVNVKYLIKL
jgi:hypothetical protein